MVRRTTIQLDPELDRLLDREAKRRNVSRSELIRDTLKAALLKCDDPRQGKRTGPFWDDHATFEGPPDLAENHDKYLYDESTGQ